MYWKLWRNELNYSLQWSRTPSFQRLNNIWYNIDSVETTACGQGKEKQTAPCQLNQRKNGIVIFNCFPICSRQTSIIWKITYQMKGTYNDITFISKKIYSRARRQKSQNNWIHNRQKITTNSSALRVFRRILAFCIDNTFPNYILYACFPSLCSRIFSRLIERFHTATWRGCNVLQSDG